MMSAIQGDKATAAVLAATCRIAYSWVVPILYFVVILESPERLVAFEAALRDSKEYAESQRGPRLLAEPLGAYVRHLWLGTTRAKPTCPVEDIFDAKPPCVHFILPLCPSLVSVAMQQCPGPPHLELMVDCLPQTLESLCIFPCASFTTQPDLMNVDLDIPNIHRLSSLRDVTVVRRMLSSSMIERLAKMPSLCGGITQIVRFRMGVQAGSYMSVDGRICTYVLQQTRNAVRQHHPGVLRPLRRHVLFAVDRPQAAVEELSRRVQQSISRGVNTSSPGGVLPSHITVRCMSNHVEGEELGLLYEDWITQRIPPSICCVDLQP